jgi:hypothetical protein
MNTQSQSRVPGLTYNHNQTLVTAKAPGLSYNHNQTLVATAR